MQPPTAVLQASRALVAKAEPKLNAHPSMKQTRTISLSRLVQSTAHDLAREILLDDQTMDGETAHWSSYGNGRADTNLRAVPCREPLITVPIPGTWSEGGLLDWWHLTGHPDGIDIRSESASWLFTGGHQGDTNDDTLFWATVYENKAPIHEPSPEKLDLYYRQGLAYLAMLMRAHRSYHVMLLQPAQWEGAPQGPLQFGNWRLPHRLVPAQVVVCVQPADAPKFEQAFPVTQDVLDKEMDRLILKAQAVIKAVLADDAEIACTEWDHAKGLGLTEFQRNEEASLDDATAMHYIIEREELKNVLDAVQGKLDAVNAKLRTFLLARGVMKTRIGGATAQLVYVKPGVRHYVTEARLDLKVTGKAKADPEAKE